MFAFVTVHEMGYTTALVEDGSHMSEPHLDNREGATGKIFESLIDRGVTEIQIRIDSYSPE